jgi:hypothetical protein
MRVATLGWHLRSVAAAVVSIGLIVALPGCDLNKQEPPPLGGPSETGISVHLGAVPDVVNADGVSTAVVELILLDQTGAPAAGRAVLFQLLSGDGVLSPSTQSTFVGPVQTGLVMATSQDGTAYVVYQAGFATTTATVGVRPYNFVDAARDFLSTVEIIQR